jgi:hypothetical protein
MPVPRLVTLYDGVAEATVAPDLGGGLASYDLSTRSGARLCFDHAAICHEPARLTLPTTC